MSKDQQLIIERAYQIAVNHLDEGTFSDLPLMYSPSKIAVAAFLLGMEEQNAVEVNDGGVGDGDDGDNKRVRSSNSMRAVTPPFGDGEKPLLVADEKKGPEVSYI